MPISFDLSSYRNTFPGEIVESDVIAGNNGNEFLRIVIAELDREGNKQSTDQKCGYGDCVLLIRHRHQPPLWESERQGSSLHRFVQSVNGPGQLNTKINFTFKDFVGKRWTFEGEKARDWVDKNTQEKHEGRTYYYVAGPIDQPVDVQPDSLPDPVTGAPMNGATNGAVAKTATKDDLDIVLASYAHGKTLQQIIQGVMLKEEVPEFINDDTYVSSIVDQSALTRCIDVHKYLVKDESGTFHATPEFQAVISAA